MRLPVIAYDTASRRRVLASQRTFWNACDVTATKFTAAPPISAAEKWERSPSEKDEYRKAIEFLHVLMDRNASGVGFDMTKFLSNVLIQGGNACHLAELLFLGPLPDNQMQQSYDEWRRANKQPRIQLWLTQISLQQRIRFSGLIIDAMSRIPPSSLRSIASVPTFLGLPLVILGSSEKLASSASPPKEDLIILEHFKSIVLTFIRCGDLQDIVLSTFLQPARISYFKRFLHTIRYPESLALCLELFSASPSYSGTVAPITTIRNALLKERILDVFMSLLYGKNKETEHSHMMASVELIMSIFVSAPAPLQKSIAMFIIPDCLRCAFSTLTISTANQMPVHSLRLKYTGLLSVVCFSIILAEAENNPNLVLAELSSKKLTSGVVDMDARGRSKSNKSSSFNITLPEDKDRPLNFPFQCYLDAIIAFSNILTSHVRSNSVTPQLLATLKTLALLLTIRSTPININDSFYEVTNYSTTDSNPNRLLMIFLSGSVNPNTSGYSIPSRFASDKVITRNFMTKICFELERTGSYRNLVALARAHPLNSILHSAIAQIFLNTAVLGYYTPVLFTFLLQSSKLSDFVSNLSYVPPPRRTSFDCFCRGIIQGLIYVATGATETHVLSRQLSNLPLLQKIYQPETQALLATTINELSTYLKNSPCDTRIQLVEILLKDPGVAAYSKAILEIYAVRPSAYDFNYKRFAQKLSNFKALSPSFGGNTIEPSPQTGPTSNTRQETGSERAKNWRASTPLPKKREGKIKRSSSNQTPPGISSVPNSGSSTAPPAMGISRQSLRSQQERLDSKEPQIAGTLPVSGSGNSAVVVSGGVAGPPSSKQQPLISSLNIDYSRNTKLQNVSPLERQYSDRQVASMMHHASSTDRLPDRMFENTIKERRASLLTSPKTDSPRRSSINASMQNERNPSYHSSYAFSGRSREAGRQSYSTTYSAHTNSYMTPDISIQYAPTRVGEKQSGTRIESPYPERGSHISRDASQPNYVQRMHTDRDPL